MRNRVNVEKEAEAHDAAVEMTRGAARGAATWGLFAMAAGCAGYMMSPIYKGLTIQFKVFLQMSAMAVGGGIEADRGLRIYERRLRMERRERSIRRDEEAWRKFEERYPEGQQQMLKQSSEGDEKPTQDST